MATLNEKEKKMLLELLGHPMTSIVLSDYEKETESLLAKLNKKRVDKKAKIEPFRLKHFVFETSKGNGSIVVTSTIKPDQKSNYKCSVDYEKKEDYLSFLGYLVRMNEFYGNRLASYQKAYGDVFNVCEKDWIERTYSINSKGMTFDSTSIYDEVGVWTRIRPSNIAEIVAMLIPRLFEEFPEEIEKFGPEVLELYNLWLAMDRSSENKVCI